MGYSDIKEMLKDARNIATGANDLQLLSKLLDIQAAVYDLYDENAELRLAIKELQNIDELSSKLKHIGDFYYLPNDESPFCSRCWEASNKLIHAQQYADWGTYKCPECGVNSYYTKEYIEQN